MKKIILGLCLMLMACGPSHTIWYFLPEIEAADGEIVPMHALPFPSLAKCQEMQKEFETLDPRGTVAHATMCVEGNLKVVTPTEPYEPEVQDKRGSI